MIVASTDCHQARDLRTGLRSHSQENPNNWLRAGFRLTIEIDAEKPKSEWQIPDSIHSRLRRLERSGVCIIRDAIEDDAGLAVFLAIDSKLEQTEVKACSIRR